MTEPTIEQVATGDRFADYCLWDYLPPNPPEGKLRSSSLLWTFLDLVPWGGPARECCELLRRALGPFQTVWGIKERDGQFSCEFYFYDYGRLERRVSVQRVLHALAPRLASPLEVSESRPYFMFSLDIGPDVLAARRLDELSLYVGNPGSSVSSGLCYNLSARGLRFDNLYYFFDRQRDLEQIRAKVACSAHLDLRRGQPGDILWPEMMSCAIVVVANKKFNDGVYFSRLPVDGFTAFLGRVAFPPPFVAFVNEHRNQLNHLLFDVGFDYAPDAQGVKVIKSAIYGLL